MRFLSSMSQMKRNDFVALYECDAQTSDAQKCHSVAFLKESEAVTLVLLSAAQLRVLKAAVVHTFSKQ